MFTNNRKENTTYGSNMKTSFHGTIFRFGVIISNHQVVYLAIDIYHENESYNTWKIHPLLKTYFMSYTISYGENGFAVSHKSTLSNVNIIFSSEHKNIFHHMIGRFIINWWAGPVLESSVIQGGFQFKAVIL